jgi:hypothetical protein
VPFRLAALIGVTVPAASSDSAAAMALSRSSAACWYRSAAPAVE